MLNLSSISAQEKYQLVTWKNKKGVFTPLDQAKRDADLIAKGFEHYKNYKIQLVITDSLKSAIASQVEVIRLYKSDLDLSQQQYLNEKTRADSNFTAVKLFKKEHKKKKVKKVMKYTLKALIAVGSGYVGYKIGYQVGKLE